MARVPGAGGVVGIDDLGKLLQSLTQAGVPKEDLAKILPSLIPAGIGVGAAAAAGPGLTSKLSDLAGAFGVNYAAERLANVGVGPTPPPYAAAEPEGSKYLFTPAAGLAYEQFYANENARRQFFNFLARSLGAEELPALETPAAFAARSAALTSRQMEEATARQIELEKAKRGYDLAIQQVASQADVSKQRLASLGDVQRQRVASSYDAATNMFNEALKNIAARERFENNATLAELAKPV